MYLHARGVTRPFQGGAQLALWWAAGYSTVAIAPAAGALSARGMLLSERDYHLDYELEHLARIAARPRFAERSAAFFNKRPPAFGDVRGARGGNHHSCGRG